MTPRANLRPSFDGTLPAIPSSSGGNALFLRVQKLLVIQTAFIGDVVLATALIEKLHACFPDAQIDFLVRKGNESLLAGHPWLHETLVWDKKQNKLKNLWAITR